MFTQLYTTTLLVYVLLKRTYDDIHQTKDGFKNVDRFGFGRLTIVRMA
ncbi:MULTISPECIES: hypothetical protein [Paenibacillus]|nr:hypothetical protein [Paenibacillus borealis]